MNPELVALAESINAARIAANAIEASAPQSGVYGHLANALVGTLELLVGHRANDAYDALLDGLTVRQALVVVHGF